MLLLTAKLKAFARFIHNTPQENNQPAIFTLNYLGIKETARQPPFPELSARIPLTHSFSTIWATVA